MRGGWWEDAGMQEEGSLRGNGNGAEPWKRPPFQTGFEAFWKTGGCACCAQTPRRHQHVCLVVDVMQVWPAPRLTRMLPQEEGVGARRSTLSVRDHSCPTVLLAAGCCGFEPSSAEAFGPRPGLAWMMCADMWCFRRSPGASCNLVLSLHAPQGAKAGVPVNFRSFGVGFVCAGFKGNITVTCLSFQHGKKEKPPPVSALAGYPAQGKETKSGDHFFKHCQISPTAHSQQRSHGFVPAFHFFVPAAGSLSPFRGRKSDSQTKKVLFLVFRMFPIKQAASAHRQQSNSQHHLLPLKPQVSGGSG